MGMKSVKNKTQGDFTLHEVKNSDKIITNFCGNMRTVAVRGRQGIGENPEQISLL